MREKNKIGSKKKIKENKKEKIDKSKENQKSSSDQVILFPNKKALLLNIRKETKCPMISVLRF